MKTASEIVKQMGGPTKAAETIGVHRTRVHDWMRSGAIPSRHWHKIISATNGDVAASDLMPRPQEAA